ncbi:hypothetical protein OM427_28110 [Halomonas sp. 18H]|uniref:hypothetical protein n=1 Tax=Halomonas almeriensis TaxID=308163 RepID=UPI00222EF8D4|nr:MULTISPECIES: hypothetical protein [Halomonas]MCW4153379.1 hypothetical protein [Halomonas sp. 18H]MDN3553806.1 hypothetical protein [Halomonas almeriensis]
MLKARGEERSYPLECLSDTHGFHQLLVGLAGRVDVEVEGRGSAVVPGGACVIPAGATHHYLGIEAANRCRVLDLATGDAALDACFEHIHFLRLPLSDLQSRSGQALLASLIGAPAFWWRCWRPSSGAVIRWRHACWRAFRPLRWPGTVWERPSSP